MTVDDVHRAQRVLANFHESHRLWQNHGGPPDDEPVLAHSIGHALAAARAEGVAEGIRKSWEVCDKVAEIANHAGRTDESIGAFTCGQHVRAIPMPPAAVQP